MPSWYLLAKFVHVLAAVFAVGANAAAGIWLERAKGKDQEAFVVKSVRFMLAALSAPGLVLLVASGVAMWALAPWPLATPWLIVGAALWATIVALLLVYDRVARRQLALLAGGRAWSPAYKRLAFAGRALGALAGAAFIATVYLMVVKPALW